MVSPSKLSVYILKNLIDTITMVQDSLISAILSLFIMEMSVNAHGTPLYNLYLGNSITTPHQMVSSLESLPTRPCLFHNKWEDCLVTPYYNILNTNTDKYYHTYYQIYNANPPEIYPGVNSLGAYTPAIREMAYGAGAPGILNLIPSQGIWPINTHTTQRSFPTTLSKQSTSRTGGSDQNYYGNMPSTRRTLNMKLEDGSKRKENLRGSIKVEINNFEGGGSTISPSKKNFSASANITGFISPCNKAITEQFMEKLDRFERKFYVTTFKKLSQISPDDRRDNGISFVQSGLFLQLALLALSVEVDEDTRNEIQRSIGFRHSEQENIKVIRQIMELLPNSTDDLKFRRASRLVLWPGQSVSKGFCVGVGNALRLRIDTFNGTEKPEDIAVKLNHMVENDSEGAIRDTFDEDDLSGGVEAMFVTTMYLRGRWRSAPTLLNGTHPFYDTDDASARSVRMIRINDVMRYADLTDWDAEAMEIFYSAPGLSLVVVMPRSSSLRQLSARVADIEDLTEFTGRMRTLRAAVTLPLYTLRMTLLLGNKLRDMGIQRLLDVRDETRNGTLRLSHAVQRLMFWAEAGRNAFKDDGIEWDEPPELSIVVNRPYIFFVRWRNMTLMNGHFAL